MTSRGSITLIVAAAAMVLMLGGLALADVGAMMLARQRAQTAADAAALAAIVQQVPALTSGEDPERAAEAEAQRNGAVLIRCDCRTGMATAVVEVQIERRAVFLPGWQGRRIRATAAAGTDAGLLTYRPPG